MNTQETKQEKALLADNKMQLIDGRVIDIYRRKEILDSIDNTLSPDTSGEYLAFYRDKNKHTPTSPDAASLADRQFFLDNVFFFVAHSEEILSDSRMFLAQVPVQNGLAYSGTRGFKYPTLGVYLEWWMNHGQSVILDKDGKLQFYWFISGSPLSGRNACAVVDENGASKQRPVSRFSDYWRTFRAINTRYDECKVFGEAYTLQQVREILQQRNDSNTHDKAYYYGLRWMADKNLTV